MQGGKLLGDGRGRVARRRLTISSGGGGCAGGDVPLGAVPAVLVWGGVSRGKTNHR